MTSQHQCSKLCELSKMYNSYRFLTLLFYSDMDMISFVHTIDLLMCCSCSPFKMPASNDYANNRKWLCFVSGPIKVKISGFIYTSSVRLHMVKEIEYTGFISTLAG